MPPAGDLADNPGIKPATPWFAGQHPLSHTSQAQPGLGNLVFKWVKDLNRHFPNKAIQMTSKHMNRCSTSLVTRETNQNHNDIPLHTYWDCYNKKTENNEW